MFASRANGSSDTPPTVRDATLDFAFSN
jgi:hypothetical protein